MVSRDHYKHNNDSVLYLPTNAQENCFKKNIKIYIKTVPTCFVATTIIRERVVPGGSCPWQHSRPVTTYVGG